MDFGRSVEDRRWEHLGNARGDKLRVPLSGRGCKRVWVVSRKDAARFERPAGYEPAGDALRALVAGERMG
jgi:hypothetical protein